ncbi:uncharacterized protein F4807DRAFT_184696 [Annulohypoxylon truncatum]|uniref:uncharacterized protein n=1 Tax=Annulohypoxylon truncatum TaxID=327061 RepID=UPI0020083725|nr:uncharacterized protein F4807DRAFT_184696 [Annulohypoxylon truncatum]KAI1207325.1 hypothetical protein F4807DRAFT_184696 [Annulohypoxylon truncatum]
MLFTGKDALVALVLLAQGWAVRGSPGRRAFANETFVTTPISSSSRSVATTSTSTDDEECSNTVSESLSTAVATLTSAAPSNVTSAAGPDFTTLTVNVTSISTIISCAPTITDCPAASNTAALSTLPSEAVSTILVTSVVDITTTVCPVTEVSKISSSIVASFTLSHSKYRPTTTSTIIASARTSSESIGISATSSAEAVGTTSSSTLSSETSITTPGQKPTETFSNTTAPGTVSYRPC